MKNLFFLLYKRKMIGIWRKVHHNVQANVSRQKNTDFNSKGFVAEKKKNIAFVEIDVVEKKRIRLKSETENSTFN